MEITGKLFEKTLKQKAVPSAAIRIRYPELTCEEHKRGERRINSFYRRSARLLLSFCEKHQPGGAKSYLCSSDFTVMFCENDVLSICRDVCETIDGVAYPAVRFADTWDVSSGTPLTLKHFISGISRAKLLRSVSVEDDRFYPPRGVPTSELRRHFRREQFYIAPDGVHIFCQPGTVSPFYEGVRTFRYGEEKGD